MSEINEILENLITHEINKHQAYNQIQDIINRFRYRDSKEVKIEETGTGGLGYYVRIRSHYDLGLKKGDKVDLIKIP